MATTIVLLDTTSQEHLSWLGRSAAFVGRPFLKWFYLGTYRRRLSLDSGKLRYYTALASLYRLARLVLYLQVGPRAAGAKTEVTQFVTQDVLAGLERTFSRSTGVQVQLRTRRTAQN